MQATNTYCKFYFYFLITETKLAYAYIWVKTNSPPQKKKKAFFLFSKAHLGNTEQSLISVHKSFFLVHLFIAVSPLVLFKKIITP